MLKFKTNEKILNFILLNSFHLNGHTPWFHPGGFIHRTNVIDWSGIEAWTKNMVQITSVSSESFDCICRACRVPVWFIISSLVFFYLSKLLFWGFLQFEGDFALCKKWLKISWHSSFKISFPNASISKILLSFLITTPSTRHCIIRFVYVICTSAFQLML